METAVPDGSPADAVATAALAELPAGLGLRGRRLAPEARVRAWPLPDAASQGPE